MSKFYGTVVGYDKKYTRSSEGTRRGFSAIEATAQSWCGSVSTELYYKDGEEKFENLRIKVRYQLHQSTSHPMTRCFDGKFEDFIDALTNYTGDQE